MHWRITNTKQYWQRKNIVGKPQQLTEPIIVCNWLKVLKVFCKKNHPYHWHDRHQVTA